MKKNVFIIGSKGIPANYGGFETFVEQLTARQENKEIAYHVACLDKERSYDDEHNKAHCFHIRIPAWLKSAKAVVYDMKAFSYADKMIKKEGYEQPIVYVLACRMGPFVGHYVRKLHRLGGTYMLNPDGHEWKRAKWNTAIKKYWKISEQGMVKHADLVICDSVSIEKYIKEDYKKYNPKTTFIAYGASFDEPGLGAEEKYAAWCTANGVKPGEYYLSVGRLVPENNFYTMIREFMKSDTAKDFVLVADNEGNKFYDSLKETTGFEKDSRIKFVGTVYDTDLIGMIRRNAYGYFHGHSVGGTNPSLLEALATTQLNLLYDVGFNREVGEDGAVYWNLEEGNLKSLIESADKYDSSYIEALSEKAKDRIRTAYEWSYIVERYEETFMK